MAVDSTGFYLLGIPEPGEAARLLTDGAAHHQAKRLSEAMACYQHAAGLAPDRYEPRNNIAIAFVAENQLAKAAEVMTEAWAMASHDLRVASNLAVIHAQRKDWAACADIMRVIRARQGPQSWIEMNLGTCAMAMLEPDEARESFERTLHLDPANSMALEKLIYLTDFAPDTTPERALELRQQWYARYGADLPRPTTYANDRDPDRPLRVGYVSADFHAHSALYCFGPVLRRHSPQIEPYAYSSMTEPEDPYTACLKAFIPNWRPIQLMSDALLAELVQQDQIDILVDLSGFSTGSRLEMFCRKPAPIQVTAWGFATGTGMPVFDYFFADPVMVPDSLRHYYVEQVIHLPSVVPYEEPWAAPYDFAPLVRPPRREGPIVFGSLNRAEKMNPLVLDTWADVLRAVPDSRLLLKSHQLTLPAVQQRVFERFTARGIDASRIEVLGTTPHPDNMLVLNRIDVSLDPFPHTGGVSALESLWMGVPVVTMIGPRAVNRLSPSFLTQLGQTDWIAESPEEYVAIATRLAKDTDGLGELRRTLRDRMKLAPMCRLSEYTQAVEDAYRMIWRRWCESR